ncbi:MAG: hypothetical protein MK106_00810 [Mariniblastus sp.]|nr:hypothetical protein [Mariniblastus sp.]
MRVVFPSSLDQALNRLIFSINSGRAGSKYLSTLLGTAKEVHSFHEPAPDMAGRYVKYLPVKRHTLKTLLVSLPVARKKLRKVETIKKKLEVMEPGEIYAETNFQYILSFYDAIESHFHDQYHVVLMRRHLPKVLKSWMELGWFRAGHRPTRYWCYSAVAPSRAVPPVASMRELDSFDQCIAYLIDIEGRAQRFLKDFPNVPVTQVRLESLSSPELVRRLFNQLGITPTKETFKKAGEVIWARTKQKKKVGRPVTEDYCRQRIHQYFERCQRLGIEVPHLSQMDPFDPRE